jgi:hypothetical protein
MLAVSRPNPTIDSSGVSTRSSDAPGAMSPRPSVESAVIERYSESRNGAPRSTPVPSTNDSGMCGR